MTEDRFRCGKLMPFSHLQPRVSHGVKNDFRYRTQRAEPHKPGPRLREPDPQFNSLWLNALACSHPFVLCPPCDCAGCVWSPSDRLRSTPGRLRSPCGRTSGEVRQDGVQSKVRVIDEWRRWTSIDGWRAARHAPPRG